ncbi:MAG: hypothetical protein JW727_05440 [Candidatus Aenigmarchaeota archaeon]|nr:hypothetical protein [Candidatus Aenigmarchaeota archaeon]
MAWKEVETTLAARDYPCRADKLFWELSGDVYARKVDNVSVASGDNSMKLKSYARDGVDANVELALGKGRFDDICSILPHVISSTGNRKEKAYSLDVGLNLGRFAEGEGGLKVPYLEHVVYSPEESGKSSKGYDPKNFLVSLVFPENIRRKLEHYGDCSAMDKDLPEAELALLIGEAALKDGFERSEKVYKCVTPVCPPPMRMDYNELLDFIRKSPSLKLEGRYVENTKGGKKESVLADITPSHLSLECLLIDRYNTKLSRDKLITPILESTEVEFSPSAAIGLNERYEGFFETLGKGFAKNVRALGKRKFLAGKRTSVRDSRGAMRELGSIPLSAGYKLLDEPLGLSERKEQAKREAELKDFFERTLSKGGVKRPDGSTCLAVMDKKCLTDKFDEKRKEGV